MAHDWVFFIVCMDLSSGRFDVFDDDPEQDILESCNGNGGLHNDVEKENVSTVSDTDQSIEFNHAEERDNEQDNANQKYNHSSTMEGLNDTQKDRYDSEIQCRMYLLLI